MLAASEPAAVKSAAIESKPKGRSPKVWVIGSVVAGPVPIIVRRRIIGAALIARRRRTLWSALR